MKITVFTSERPRHISLLNYLADIAGEVYAVIEAKKAGAAVYESSDIMHKYFARVKQAEREIFGIPHPLPKNVHTMTLRMDELRKLDIKTLDAYLKSDIYVVFGSSHIKGRLPIF